MTESDTSENLVITLLDILPDAKNKAELPKFAENVPQDVREFIKTILPKLEKNEPVLRLVSGENGRLLFEKLKQYPPEQQVGFVRAAWLAPHRPEIDALRKRKKRAMDLVSKIQESAYQLAELIDEFHQLVPNKEFQLVSLLGEIEPEGIKESRKKLLDAGRDKKTADAAVEAAYGNNQRRLAKALSETNPYWTHVSLHELLGQLGQKAAQLRDCGLDGMHFSRQRSQKREPILHFIEALESYGFDQKSRGFDVLVSEAMCVMYDGIDFEPQDVNKAKK